MAAATALSSFTPASTSPTSASAPSTVAAFASSATKAASATCACGVRTRGPEHDVSVAPLLSRSKPPRAPSRGAPGAGVTARPDRCAASHVCRAPSQCGREGGSLRRFGIGGAAAAAGARCACASVELGAPRVSWPFPLPAVWLLRSFVQRGSCAGSKRAAAAVPSKPTPSDRPGACAAASATQS